MNPFSYEAHHQLHLASYALVLVLLQANFRLSL